jgi:LytR cell envelope-related transcriptional attenuator
VLAIVQEFGALAGLAAVVGLLVLSALYVPHARGVKRLREWAGRGPESVGRGVAAHGAIARRSQPWHSRTGARSAAVLVVGLLAVGVGISVAGGDGADHSGKTQAGDSGLSSKPKRGGVTVNPGSVTVAVLNGTTVNGLAAALRDQIVAAGFRKGTINSFSDQQLAESVVEYAPGHQAEAQAVGRRFGISRREPVTANSRALAGGATLIVIAGADKAP